MKANPTGNGTGASAGASSAVAAATLKQELQQVTHPQQGIHPQTSNPTVHPPPTGTATVTSNVKATTIAPLAVATATPTTSGVPAASPNNTTQAPSPIVTSQTGVPTIPGGVTGAGTGSSVGGTAVVHQNGSSTVGALAVQGGAVNQLGGVNLSKRLVVGAGVGMTAGAATMGINRIEAAGRAAALADGVISPTGEEPGLA